MQDALPMSSPSITGDRSKQLDDLCHDLRQPLSAIEMIAYSLQQTVSPLDRDVLHRLDQIRQMTAQMDSLLNDACAPDEEATPVARSL
jgi:signal transduction histidine kinase